MHLPVVITLHLEVEDLRLAGRRLGDKVGVQEVEHDLADVAELNLDLLSVFLGDGLKLPLAFSKKRAFFCRTSFFSPCSHFCSMELMIRQLDRRAPTTFL